MSISCAGDENTAWYWLGIVNGTAAGVGGLVDWAQRTGFEQTGMDTNAMAEAPLVALYSICLGFRFARDKPRVQALLGFLATINFCWVFLTGSRGGLLVAVICLSLLLWETRGLGRRLVIAVGAALIGIVILTQFTDMRQRTVQRVTRLFDSSNSAANRTSGRSDLATGAWRVFQDHPLGVGTGGFAYHFSKLENQEGLARRFRGRRVQAHSLWTKSLSENGIIGLVVLVGYVFSFAVVGWIRRKPGVGHDRVARHRMHERIVPCQRLLWQRCIVIGCGCHRTLAYEPKFRRIL